MFRIKQFAVIGVIALAACATGNDGNDAKTTEIAPEVMTGPVVTQAWDQIRIGTYNNLEFSRLFTEIGDYTAIYADPAVMVLEQNGHGAQIVLEEMPMDAPKARPANATSWDTGCYWSLMMRAVDVPGIVQDAEALGWLPKTPVAYLEFGPSKLNVVVLTHQKTGAQVQLYERLTTPLPDDYPEFERFGVPFNIMQMARDRDAAYRFFCEQLGFATFYHGEPYVSEEPELMPLGIPAKLTTTVPYRASIVSPVKGMETGRFEMIEVMGAEEGLVGRDFSETCNKASVGLTEVTYKVDHTRKIVDLLRERGVSVSTSEGISFKSPDGANIRLRHAD